MKHTCPSLSATDISEGIHRDALKSPNLENMNKSNNPARFCLTLHPLTYGLTMGWAMGIAVGVAFAAASGAFRTKTK